MRIFVFTGPTLSAAEGAKELEATYLPPASQGDVYAAARERPWGIGIIDGYFERVPAVWHKEVLWAMAQGVHVFGSASMGALRAAELATFGMEGVGVVFEAFHTLELEDDDEVAIAHGGPETAYRSVSEAMVNIRATLASSTQSGVIEAETRDALIGIAKRMFYPDRNYPALLAAARRQGLRSTELDGLESWLPAGRRNQKRSDAIEMLRVMRAQRDAGRPPKQVRYTFQHTDAWEQVRRQILTRTASSTVDHYEHAAVMEELRLEGPGYLSVRDHALLEALAHEVGETGPDEVDGALLPKALEEFRRQHGLLAPGSVEPWLEQQGLGVETFVRLLRAGLRTDRVRALFETELERVVVDRLRMGGRYAMLAERASRKQRVLSSRGRANAGLEEVGISETALFRWYFEEHLDLRDIPSPAVYARALGYPDVASLRRAILREWCFVRADAPGPRGRSAQTA